MICLFWDIACLLATMHDSVMIPLLSSFDIDPVGAPNAMAKTSGIIWLCDMLVSFVRGFLNVRTGLGCKVGLVLIDTSYMSSRIRSRFCKGLLLLP